MVNYAKKSISLLLVMTLVISMLCTSAFAVSEPKVTASAAIAMDYDTGEVLYAKDIDTMRVPASMTKIMTAYILYQELEKGNITMDTQVPVSENAARISKDRTYPMSIPLTAGDTIPVSKLIGLIMIPSASASCIVAAEYISGSETEFVKRMNATAEELGMKAAYQNCHGARPHYITARSIAILIRNFIQKYPDILNYTSQTSIEYKGNTWKNTNKLLTTYYYEGADGFKTGTIPEAGFCLSATAHRNDKRIITVVMNSASTAARHTDSAKLLDYGFEEIQRREQSKASTYVTFTAKPAEPVRAGVNTSFEAKLGGITNKYCADQVTLTINGEEINKVNSTEIYDECKFSGNYILKNSTDQCKISLEIKLPGGEKLNFEKDLEVSDLPAPVFLDIAGHWAEPQITTLYNRGTLTGYNDGTFKPNGTVTRAEFVKIISDYIPRSESDVLEFTDINEHWAKDYITDAASAGIIAGYDDGTFKPDAKISRQEIAVILHRLLKAENNSGTKIFVDQDKIAPWAKDAVSYIADLGIIKGNADGTFAPERNMTRAECAAVIVRIENLL